MGMILSFTEDCLPPEQEYESRDALFKAINDWAAHRGYAFTTGRSTVEKSGRQTITYTCDRSCRPPSSTRERQRKTTTRGTGCKFSVLAKESLDKSRWTLRHRPDTRFSLHNHPPSQHLSAHPIHRKLPEEDQTQLERLANAGIAPRHIRTYLRQYCNSAATQQDVYNCLAATRRKLCEGQTTIHALANQLDEEGFWSRMQFGSDGRVTAVLLCLVIFTGPVKLIESRVPVNLLAPVWSGLDPQTRPDQTIPITAPEQLKKPVKTDSFEEYLRKQDMETLLSFQYGLPELPSRK
ncbi:PKS-NRPS hybrid synthetase [Fusarium oxysporum f. sp. conglutinans]|nr:PKS-NRPS hybrid synthetase [Fusarium oxysporum f. sp. conglutinans]